MTNFGTDGHPGSNTKRSQETVACFVLSLVYLAVRLSGVAAQSLILSLPVLLYETLHAALPRSTKTIYRVWESSRLSMSVPIVSQWSAHGDRMQDKKAGQGMRRHGLGMQKQEERTCEQRAVSEDTRGMALHESPPLLCVSVDHRTNIGRVGCCCLYRCGGKVIYYHAKLAGAASCRASCLSACRRRPSWHPTAVRPYRPSANKTHEHGSRTGVWQCGHTCEQEDTQWETQALWSSPCCWRPRQCLWSGVLPFPILGCHSMHVSFSEVELSFFFFFLSFFWVAQLNH